jgi:cytochrome b pre-mRNA-processing protein 3
MILPLFRRAAQAGTISALYGTIVAQARLPIFYRDYGVPDTVDGRFELIVLHLFLFLRRLDQEGDRAKRLGQQVFDRFCQDMDQNLREMGVGDLKVPKEMRRIGEAYYGRVRAYETALKGAEPSTFPSALARNIFGAAAELPTAERLATYATGAIGQLAAQDIEAFGQGLLRFPEP